MEFRNLNEISKFKGVVYGDPGSGKTHLVTTLPEPIGVINTAPGNINTYAKFRKKEIYVADFSELQQPHNYTKLIEFINKVITGTEFANCNSIAIDDYSGMMDIFMDMSMNLMTYKGGKKIPRGSMGEPDRSHYHGENVKCVEFITKLFKLPKHILITMHEQVLYDKDDGVIIGVVPLARGSAKGRQVTKLVSEVYRMTSERRVVNREVKNVKLMQVTKDSLSYAKTSLCDLAGIAGDKIEPNISTIISKLEKNLNA